MFKVKLCEKYLGKVSISTALGGVSGSEDNVDMIIIAAERRN